MTDPFTSSLSHSPSMLWFSSLLLSSLDPIVNHFNPHLQILPIVLSSTFFSCMHLAKPKSSYSQGKVKSLSRVRLCDPVDCSLPSSSVHGILHARILEWVAISFSRGSSQPRDQTLVSHIAGRCFNL